MRRSIPGSRLGFPALVAVAVVLFAAACSDDRDSASTGATAVSPGGGAAAEGAALYEQACASCHGSDLRGTERGPSHLSQVYAAGHHSDAAFRSAVARGSPAHHWDFGDMPPVPGLTDAQVDAIIDFIRQQQDQHGLEPYPPR